MDILTHAEFQAELHSAKKVGVLKQATNGYVVVETVYQNLYTGNLLVQVDTTYSDGTVSTHYEEGGADHEIKAFAQCFQQQKECSE